MLVSGTVFVIDYNLSALAYEQNLSPDGSLQMQFEGKKKRTNFITISVIICKGIVFGIVLIHCHSFCKPNKVNKSWGLNNVFI